jgi:tight adherence protein C
MNSPWFPLAVFGGIGLTILLLGQLLIGLRRNRTAAGTVRRPLVFGPLTGLLAALVPTSNDLREALDRELKQAGFYEPRSVEQFLSIRNALFVGWMLLMAAAAYVANQFHPEYLLALLAGGAVVLVLLYAVPRLWLQSIAARRVQRIQTALPDALDMITMCLTGGLPLQPALERVGKEVGAVHPDLGLELEIIRRQADAHTLDHALTQFANRIDVPEISSLAALVSQTERLGTNVATALRDYADSIRRGFRQRAEEKGNKNSVKLLFPVALCLAPPVYILLLAPAALELREFIVRENRPGGVLVPNEFSLQSPIQAPTLANPATRPGAESGVSD